ncbi:MULTISPECIES: alpha/beta fold hydrolase [unclassified Janthinobacterium]|uniref:alpha/beta fold hydrolase n=1 Tax=unclassified Janthinobacterium TaxID=2610881 RepID=UPI00161DDE40|nr:MULTISPECIES: alpha/beta hydrolase [unclassified Janthinobacterium]MBB5606784.1 iron complex outermembrane receptor protein [Janthinobacterium sp. S3T4]MBB5612166.1 iron complex outermembrane receptor protein [Janthinobacterium sp. S3M3]
MRRHTTSDVPLHYLDLGLGKPGGEGEPTHHEPILLLHGLGSCAQDWQPQIEALSPNYRLIVPDMRGHGRSPAPEGAWQIADFANDIFNLMDQLDVPRAHVVGFSLGGMVGLEMANLAPGRIASLCLINSQPFQGSKPPALLFAYWLRRTVIATFGLKAMGKIIGKKLFPDPEQQPLVERFAAQMADMDKRAYLAALDAIFHWQIEVRFDALTMPVRILAADQDYTPVASKQAFAAQFPHCEFEVIANSRHATPLDQAQRVNTLLRSFLSSHSK